MTAGIAKWVNARFGIPEARTQKFLYRAAIIGAAVGFILIATIVVVYDELSAVSRSPEDLQVGAVAPYNVIAPQTIAYTSQILTQDARTAAASAVQSVYDPPDPNIARQQTQLATQILTFVGDIRADSYGTNEQRTSDISAITALQLGPITITTLLNLSDDAWNALSTEIINTMSLAMRESIRESDLVRTRAQLSNLVSVRFNEGERDVVVDIVEDLIRANTFLNEEATTQARTNAEAQVGDITRSLVRGERVVSEAVLISPLAYEAMNALGLLDPVTLDPFVISSGFLMVLVVMVMIGLYLAHFSPLLIYRRVKMFILLAGLFLVMLIAVRFIGLTGIRVLFPYATLSLLFVVIIGHHEAIVASIGLGILVGYMANSSLEMALLAIFGGVIGALSLRSTQRLNAFFVSGTIVGVTNVAVVAIFQLNVLENISTSDLISTLLLTFIGGAVLLPATTIAGMYIITQLFNLPTTLRLIDLSQPNKPLLQRMLREAPGTYQHSLQVANLVEQAAERIHADAELVHVAALYHDIGKMENPLFFTENQPDPSLNPHNMLKDPYRSAAIIIEHVTKGEEMAKQYGLPRRLRDFILEHHGTTKVGYFYKVALDQVDGDSSLIDVSAFEYPGPKPRSRETGLMMLADSCEATVRSKQPRTHAEITKIVDEIFEGKRREGQLDECGLTLTDIAQTHAIFIEILQGMYHHRIKYQEDNTSTTPMTKVDVRPLTPAINERVETSEIPAVRRTGEIAVLRPYKMTLETDDDNKPMNEVPRLPRTEDRANGKSLPIVQPQEHDE